MWYYHTWLYSLCFTPYWNWQTHDIIMFHFWPKLTYMQYCCDWLTKPFLNCGGTPPSLLLSASLDAQQSLHFSTTWYLTALGQRDTKLRLLSNLSYIGRIWQHDLDWAGSKALHIRTVSKESLGQLVQRNREDPCVSDTPRPGEYHCWNWLLLCANKLNTKHEVISCRSARLLLLFTIRFKIRVQYSRD